MVAANNARQGAWRPILSRPRRAGQALVQCFQLLRSRTHAGSQPARHEVLHPQPANPVSSGRNGCILAGMVEVSYRVVPGSKGSFDVELLKPGRRARRVPGFRSIGEADAWGVQAVRLIYATNHTPMPPRVVRPVPAR